MGKKKQGRKKGLIWFHFIEGPMINSSHYEAKCKYCFEKTLHNLDNKTKKNKHKHSRIETADSDDNGNLFLLLILFWI